MWTIDGHMVIFPQPCLNVVKKFRNEMIFAWYAGLIYKFLKNPLDNCFLSMNKLVNYQDGK